MAIVLRVIVLILESNLYLSIIIVTLNKLSMEDSCNMLKWVSLINMSLAFSIWHFVYLFEYPQLFFFFFHTKINFVSSLLSLINIWLFMNTLPQWALSLRLLPVYYLCVHFHFPRQKMAVLVSGIQKELEIKLTSYTLV